MSKSKRIFLLGAIIFFAILFYASYDISKKTTFPGSKPQLPERLKNIYLKTDTLKPDTTGLNR